MTTSLQTLINEVLANLFQGKAAQAVSLLEQQVPAEAAPQHLGLLRLATLCPGQPLLYYLRLNNLWTRLGKPALKPNAAARKVTLLCDYTTDGIKPLLTLFCAALGTAVEIEATPFDSVEQLAFDPHSPLPVSAQHLVVLSLSEYWLSRYLGTSALVDQERIDQLKEVLRTMLAGLEARGPAHVLVTNFPGRAYAQPGGSAALGSLMGWNRAVAQLNHWLGAETGSRAHLVDFAEALFGAGGRTCVGRLSYLRSKMVFETAGTIAAARELAFGVAHLCGKTHRAVVTDWDNTIWGGEVAEEGSHGIVCGLDSPDGLAYTQVQEFLKGLKPLGILLAAASRNDPKVTAVFADNPNLPLKLEDFASTQVAFQPKSAALGRVAEDLGFGTEYMVFVDDSLFELTEVVSAHPYVDVIKAGPGADSTLRALSESRFFNALSLSQEDIDRNSAAQSLRQQREVRANFHSLEDFLRAIQIKLDVAPLNEKNIQRVAQMFQKSNQFNLTTRRHTEQDLRRLESNGGRIGVFSYQDSFGFQGVIAVVNLLMRPDAVHIESWLMSCRVLNRTVEQAVFDWVLRQADGQPVVGEFLPTQKNGLVADLYKRLGFQLSARDAATRAEIWRLEHQAQSVKVQHFAEIREAA